MKHAARRAPTILARQRLCPQVAKQLQSALQHHVEVVVDLATALDAAPVMSPGRVVPSDARRARSHRCDVHPSACRCKNVLWSCLCSAVEMCIGVCTVGVHARVLARACGRVPRRRCRTSRLALETVRPGPPFPSCRSRTTGRGREREGTRHGALFTESFLKSLSIGTNTVLSYNSKHI